MNQLRNLRGWLTAALIVAVCAFAAPTFADDTTVDAEELSGTDAASTDNVGPEGDTQTGGAFSSKWQECSSARINKYHTRGSASFYRFLWSLVGPVDERDVWLAETLWYRYCPNGIRPDKVKPLAWRYCHVHYPAGQVAPFQGIFFTSYMTDDRVTWDQRAVFVPKREDGTGEGSGGASCNDYKIVKADRKWFRVVRTTSGGAPTYTRYTTATNARVSGIRDTYDWIVNPGQDPIASGSHIATVSPFADTSVGGWYGGPAKDGKATDSALTTDTSADIPPGIGVPPVPTSPAPTGAHPVCPPDAPAGCYP